MTEVLAPLSGPPQLTAAQRRIFDELLVVGGSRPTCPDGLAEQLAATIATGTEDAIGRWTERSVFLTKSTISTVLRCEGQTVAQAATALAGPGLLRALHPSAAVGLVTHRALQLAYTHPGQSVVEYVRGALAAERRANEQFAAFCDSADMGIESDLITQATGRVCAFLDTWPPLDPAWTPRFEDPIAVSLGGVKLSARPDLALGRPRSDGRQTMVLTDFKSGMLHDDHPDEAAFYALVSTLRHGVAPYRSVVFSMSSGEWTDPDVTTDMLFTAADRVVAAVIALVDVKTDARPVRLTLNAGCAFCPAKEVCPALAGAAADAAAAAQEPAAPLTPARYTIALPPEPAPPRPTGSVAARGAVAVPVSLRPTAEDPFAL